MNAIELKDESGKYKVYMCGICHLGYANTAQAENCCKPKYCQCGVEIQKNYRTLCDKCSAASEEVRLVAAFEKAKEIKWEELDGDYVSHPYGPDDGFFMIDDLYDWIDDLIEEKSATLEFLGKHPWVFSSKKCGHGLTSDIIENYLSEHLDAGDYYEGAADNVVAMTEEEKASINGWLKKCDFEMSIEDKSRKINIASIILERKKRSGESERGIRI